MKKILFFTVFAVLISARLCIAAETDGFEDLYDSLTAETGQYENPDYKTYIYQDSEVCRAEIKSFAFESGDLFELYNYTFSQNSHQGNSLTNGFSIPGSSISIRYYNMKKGHWTKVTDINNLPKETLFIDTDQYHLIIGVPTVYVPYGDSYTAVIYSSLEKPVTVSKAADGKHYDIKYSFNSSGAYSGSLWTLKSERRLVAWENENQLKVIMNDLVYNARFLWDGYYFTEPAEYSPYYGYGSYYRAPSAYAAAVFAHYGSFPGAYDLGYAFTYICMENQNEAGFWETGPRVGWLYSDFGIGGGFYDTRFNTDFAKGLLYAYDRYKNPAFLSSFIKYTEFYFSHAEEYSYETENGGILVQDYGFEGEHKSTHCSLNHQLAEMNLLYNAYGALKYEPYRELADRLLQAVEDTCGLWIMNNNNLVYALYYSGSSNVMTDYPYLTYNDLFETRQILRDMFGKESQAVNSLMAAKLKWMTAAGVTGYYK